MTRTRRTVRTVAAVLGSAALLLTACGDQDPTVVSEPIDEAGDVEEEVEDPETPEPDTDDAAGDDEAEPPATTGDDGTDEPAVSGGDDDPEVAATSLPDPALVADPCAPEQGREGDAFITVVSPVAGQQVAGGNVELVGCSNVFEANVQWSLYDGDGRELDSGFTTAECGSGCVGAFAEEISLEAAGGETSVELHVYAEDMSGEHDRLHLSAIPLVLG